MRLARAITFVGWMAAVLDWTVEQPLELDGDAYRGVLRAGKREIEVELRPVSTTLDGTVRTAGSLVRVGVTASHPNATTHVRVTRQADHLLGTADWNGAQVAHQVARLDVFDEMPFLAEALDRSGHDKWFEHALDRSVDMVSKLVAADVGAGPGGGRRASLGAGA